MVAAVVGAACAELLTELSPGEGRGQEDVVIGNTGGFCKICMEVGGGESREVFLCPKGVEMAKRWWRGREGCCLLACNCVVGALDSRVLCARCTGPAE